MGHSHAGHSHGASADADRGKLWIALALILGFMAAEVVTGIVANSLALLSDAAHMLTDAAAIGLSLVALRLSSRPAEGSMTFGLKRAEILSAQANGITLLVLAALIGYEAVRRLIEPPAVDGTLVLFVALAGIVVNLAATMVLARANRESLNIEGSFQHILTDLYAFIGTAIAATVILLTGFDQADALASLMVAALMLRSAYGLLRESGFREGEVYRLIVRRDSDGANHMVSVWFEDPQDPWVIDATGAMSREMLRYSQMPAGWTPRMMFDETTMYNVVPREPGRFELAHEPDPNQEMV